MLKKDRVHAFCDYFIRRKLDLCFFYEAGTSVWLTDEDVLKKMRQAGFYAMRFPIETGNEKTLAFIRKPIDLGKTKELIRTTNKLGFWTSANFIIGFPYETREDIMETIRYAYDTALDYASFFIAKPNAGSDLYEVFKQEGLLDKAIVHGSHYYRSDYDTTTMTADELNKILRDAERRWFLHKLMFYSNPMNFMNHLLPKLQSFDDVSYLFRIVGVLFRRKINPILRSMLTRRHT